MAGVNKPVKKNKKRKKRAFGEPSEFSLSERIFGVNKAKPGQTSVKRRKKKKRSSI